VLLPFNFSNSSVRFLIIGFARPLWHTQARLGIAPCVRSNARSEGDEEMLFLPERFKFAVLYSFLMAASILGFRFAWVSAVFAVLGLASWYTPPYQRQPFITVVGFLVLWFLAVFVLGLSHRV